MEDIAGIRLYVFRIKRCLSFSILVVFLCCGGPHTLLQAQKDQSKKKETVKKPSDLYLRAPGVVPGTLPKMRQAYYWVSKMKYPDKVVLTQMEIESWNKDYKEKMANESLLDSLLIQRMNKQFKSRPGLLASIPDISSLSSSELSALIQNMIKSQTDYLRSRVFGNIMAIEYDESELNAIEKEISFDNTKSQVKPRIGITTTESRLHVMPSIMPEYIGLFTNGKARWDLWCLDVLPIGTPIQVLYSSQSAAFFLVLTDRGYGWVRAENIAIGSVADVIAIKESKEFVICTGDREPFYADANCTTFLGWMRMGDRLPLVPNTTRSVQIPTRNSKGAFIMEKAWLRSDADVHKGYLPYTSRNVAGQAFKLLDNLYDWTGAWYGRNHITVLRDIFRSFGFNLPSNGILLSAYGKRSSIVVSPKEGREAQFSTIFSNEPFLTLQICENSHSQMYLGNHEGMPIVFDAHGYGYKNEEGYDMELKRWVVGTMLMPDYFLKQDIIFIKLY